MQCQKFRGAKRSPTGDTVGLCSSTHAREGGQLGRVSLWAG
ncbi:MAG TPA: hypothetical protein V6D12_18355 [Candidatus Obscuribacterales bacterium]